MTLSSRYSRAPLLTVALLASASMASSTMAADTASQAFEFRGARLGMSIEEFEALPALSTARLSEYGPRGKKLREGLLTRCAPDKDKINNQLGVVECSRAGDDPFTPQQYRYAYTAISYKFGPDASGVKRLFSILVITPRDNYAEALSGVRSKWGNGTTVASTATNGLGQPLPKATETWRKPKGTVELETLCGDVTTICLTYTDTGLVTDLATRRAGISGGVGARF